MEQAPVPWPCYDLNLGQRQLSPQTRNDTLLANLPAPTHQLTQTPIPDSEGQAIDPPCQDNDRKLVTRTFQACLFCQDKKRKCEGGLPCNNCVRYNKQNCQFSQTRPSKSESMLDYVKGEIRGLHDKIDAIAFATGASENRNPKLHGTDGQPTISLKRKHSSSATVIAHDEGSVSSSSTTPATQDSYLDFKLNFRRCLIWHNLCPSPKNTSLGEHGHFFIHAFIPGRTFLQNHSFSDVMRQHHTITQTFIMPILTTLYLEQVQKRFFDTKRRRQLDIAVVQKHIALWKSDYLAKGSDSLYFTLLANQYMIIRPRLKTVWTQYIVPSLRSNAVQMTLLDRGDLGLRLKINSHWIFSDIAFRLCPSQPSSFLSSGEESLDEIDPLVGLSPKLLNIYAHVTWQLLEPRSPTTQETTLLEGLTRVSQYLPHLGGLSSRERKILEDCASAYLHGAYIYFLCRREGRPASDPTVQQHRKELYQLLDPGVLPLSGRLYRAVWPLVPAFILCVTCADKEERHTLREGLIQDLHESGGYSNIPPALDAISMVWLNRKLDMLKEGWWEDMVAVIGSERISLT